MTDVVVVGAGPSGRALAHRLLHRGVDVCVVDANPSRRWTATYAAWTDDLPDWLPAGSVATQVSSVQIRTPGAIEVSRGYTVLDTAGLQRGLTIDGARTIVEHAADVGADRVITASGVELRASTVIDARGIHGGAIRQTAWGVVVSRTQAAPVLDSADAILMDWSPTEQDDDDRPSFLYAVPVGDDRVLLEETSLAGAPPMPISRLRRRLRARLADRAVTPLADETVSFSLVGAPAPWRSRPLLFGARGGLMHPATGYSVAASLTAADRIAECVAAGHDPIFALWARPARTVYRLRRVGLSALLSLDAEQTRRFFEVFARLPVDRQRAYLSGRDDLTGTLRAMTSLFAGVDQRTRWHLAQAVLHP
ncbi:lycopene cyclase family protein [Gordonia sp. CPCC 206044]|uniref:lycopene cyclase family protein n=1 Tax=Gordonia sp. CPCC 206044 TaxID=3140793 RepID=UPI003AF39637